MNTASLIVPIAQATVISAPILLRDQIRRGASQVIAWQRGDRTHADEPAVQECESLEADQPDG